ncbi:hypothetical protein BJ912DRAFT_1044618 [Pholiota molesta]|nr:hypothetical protein BJ912DRAFT_1044618 [Pholiota molesta]
MRQFRKVFSRKGKERERPYQEDQLSAHQQLFVPQPSRNYVSENRTTNENAGTVDVQENFSGEPPIPRIEEQDNNHLTTRQVSYSDDLRPALQVLLQQPSTSSPVQYRPPPQQSPENARSGGFLANSKDAKITGGSFEETGRDHNVVNVYVGAWGSSNRRKRAGDSDAEDKLERMEGRGHEPKKSKKAAREEDEETEDEGEYDIRQQCQPIPPASRSISPITSGNISDRQAQSDYQAQSENHVPSVSIADYLPDNGNAIYERHLKLKKRGFPLWIPGPNMSRPMPYRRQGVDIGDVGIITPSGAFSFLFNIRLSSNDPINPPELPEGFAPISPPIGPWDLRKFRHFGPGSYLASSHIERIHDDSPSPGLSFKTSAAEGAILTLPEGAIEVDLENIPRFEAYAAANIESWYRYANGHCGRQVKNGEIRLVIGCDKATSWGVAAVANWTQHITHHIKYRPSEHSDGRTMSASIPLCHWEYSGMTEARVGPDLWEIEELKPDDDSLLEIGGKYWNQSLFLRTLNITLKDNVFNAINEGLKLAAIQESQQSRNAGGSNNSARISSNAISGSITTFQKSDAISGNQRNSASELSGPTSTGSIKNVAPAMPTGKERATMSISPSAPISHPADFLNTLLLQKATSPNIRAVVTQDKHWCSVITDDDEIMPNDAELAERVLSVHQIREVDGQSFIVINTLPTVILTTYIGVVYLGPKDHPSPEEPQTWLTSDFSDFSEKLEQILKEDGSVPSAAMDGLIQAFVDGGGESIVDAFDRFFDFSFSTLEDEEGLNAPTPDLVSSSSTNPSPDSNHETEASAHHTLASASPELLAAIKTEEAAAAATAEMLRLGSRKDIDGGEASYHQTNEWKWDSPMASAEDQPWANFNS